MSDITDSIDLSNHNQPDLDLIGDKWLELKRQRMQNLFKIALPDEALYREIMLSLGYPKNKVQFLELALLIPYKVIKQLKDRETIEKALLYRAGFIDKKDGLPDDFDSSLKMDRSVWTCKGIRPSNYPEKRITGISCLLAESVNVGLVNFFETCIKNEIQSNSDFNNVRKSVKRIMSFKGIGIERKRDMFFNIILSFMLVYAELNGLTQVEQFLTQIFENHPPLLENSVIKRYRKTQPAINYKTVKQYFGILHWIKVCVAERG